VHSFLFYLYEAKTKKLTTLGDGEKVLGVHANDLLAQKQWFPAGRNFAVSLSLEDDGTIEVDPTLADDEVWEGKDIVYEIVFRWDGTGFVREIKRVQCRGACCRHLGAGGRGDLAG
jgi:hypothetical protein